jgi:hypothetical protein
MGIGKPRGLKAARKLRRTRKKGKYIYFNTHSTFSIDGVLYV